MNEEAVKQNRDTMLKRFAELRLSGRPMFITTAGHFGPLRGDDRFSKLLDTLLCVPIVHEASVLVDQESKTESRLAREPGLTAEELEAAVLEGCRVCPEKERLKA